MLQRSTPVLPVLDLKAGTEWYREKLGFETDGLYPDYAVLRKENAHIHLWLCGDKYICENTSCYIYVTEIDALYAHCRQMEIVHPNGPLETKPWGLREFSVLDLCGNLLRFGQLLS